MSSIIKHTLNATLLAASLACATAAMAHAHLQNAAPAADSIVQAPADLRLSFSEGIEAGFSQVSVSEGGHPIAIKSVATDPADKKLLIVTPAEALKPGTYKVDWHALSVDTHKSQGTYTFKISD